MDNQLILTIEQREGEQVLSRLALEYPRLPNEQANAISLDLVDAIAAVVRGYAAAKAELAGSPPVLIDVIRGKRRGT